ncbi:glycosyltransferase [Romboutsia maritimum]|uniref:Glycosyltransferase n=1 Tax=Romboutsia maritimum TaxID=2020948 RepID=A0A371IVJ9_9FIRM|nr:glycosyltransferase family 4 protein [Romboutsia maritimum]RDY24513.1 glycosyltransferase [Romboutsia maritimum]
MFSILHITAHMGGGVGKVLSGIANYAKKSKTKYNHKIILLEKPEKINFIQECIDLDVEIMICENMDDIYREIKKADIVQLEWWHHPKFAEFLYEISNISTRLIIWSHISGCVYPNIPYEFVKVPDKFLFTSECSYENPQWSEKDKEYIKRNTKVINSSGGFDRFENKELVQHKGFNIGYIGTLSYSKLNNKFHEYYGSINIKDSKFIIVGDSVNTKFIIDDLKKSGVYNKTHIKGYVDDVSEEMKEFDVFSYLLNKDHFGTTENVLLEAMAIGLPVVAINQCAEKHIIKHMETGILVNSIEEYKQAINYLYNHPEERKRIGQNAKQFVISEYSVKKTVEKLDEVYDEIIKEEKKMYDFKSVFGKYPYEWFLACLGREKEEFENSLKVKEKELDYNKISINTSLIILKEKNKSSIYQFLKYYPDDTNLKYWSEIIK